MMKKISLLENNETHAEARTKILLQKLEEREKEQQLISELNLKLSSLRSTDEFRKCIQDHLKHILYFENLLICRADVLLKSYKLNFISENPALSKELNLLVEGNYATNDGFFNTVINSADEVRFNLFQHVKKKTKLPAYVTHYHKKGIREFIGVPLQNQETQTVIFFLLKETEKFDKKQLRILKGIIFQLGTTLSTLLFIEKIEEQRKEIELYKKLSRREKDSSSNDTELSSEIIGQSTAIKKTFQLIKQVAASDSTVLIMGESGTGKELIARAIHKTSLYSDKHMVTINCGAIPANLIESELFGHEKGSFTGAYEKKAGKFEQANNSTLFLDEIGELPLELQVKLLRVLQEKEFERIGGKGSIKVNVRIIAASNRNLQKEVDAGRFRADLFYRLNVFPITLPALRERREDIPVLSSHFINLYTRSIGKKTPALSEKVLNTMLTYSWPGNIRELQHTLERAVLLSNGNTIKEIHFPDASNKEHAANLGDLQIKTLHEMERDYILSVIKLCSGRISGTNGAASKLGLPSTTLISKMAKLGIKKEHFVKKI